MKQIYILLVFTLNVVIAHADFVIQQRIESTDQNGIVTMKITADKTRLDMPTARLGDISIIQDLNTGDKIMMINQQKLAKLEPAAVSSQGNNSDDGQIPKLVDTGETGKVGDYNTEIYTWRNDYGTSATLWVATNYPDYPKLKILLKKLRDSRAGQMLKTTQPDTSELPGMVVKSKKQTPLGEVTTTLISAKEELVAAADFQIPSDYHVTGVQAAPGKATP